MSMIYKPDWEETKAKLNMWWTHEEMDRCALGDRRPGDRMNQKSATLID